MFLYHIYPYIPNHPEINIVKYFPLGVITHHVGCRRFCRCNARYSYFNINPMCSHTHKNMYGTYICTYLLIYVCIYWESTSNRQYKKQFTLIKENKNVM